MRIQSLHRKVMRDMEAMIDVVNVALPVKMPLRYETRRMNVGAFTKRLNTITKKFGVLSEIEEDAEVPKGSSALSGAWYPEEMLPTNGSSTDVRLVWHPHPGCRRIKMSPSRWARARYYFWERLGHELVHRYQDLDRAPDSQVRTFKVKTTNPAAVKEQQTYFGDYDELEAYAHDSALELLTWWPDCVLKESVGCASRVNGAIVWSTYHSYLSAFEVGHPARTHFRRKVKQWYHAMQGAPEFYAKLGLAKLV